MGKVLLWVFSFPVLWFGVFWLAMKANLSVANQTAFCVSQNHVADMIATCQYSVTYGACLIVALWVMVGIWIFRS